MQPVNLKTQNNRIKLKKKEKDKYLKKYYFV